MARTGLRLCAGAVHPLRGQVNRLSLEPFRSSSFFETYSWHEKKGNKFNIPLSVFPWSPNALLSTSAVGTASRRPQTAQQLTRRGEEPCRIVGLEIDAVLLYSILKQN